MSGVVAQQGTEAGLHEVLIVRQRVGHAVLAHRHERDAIDEAPVFVAVGGLQIETIRKEVLGQPDNTNVG